VVITVFDGRSPATSVSQAGSAGGVAILPHHPSILLFARTRRHPAANHSERRERPLRIRSTTPRFLVEVSAAACFRAMELITILNRCHRFQGFVYQHARLSPDKKSIEVSVRLRRGFTAVCSCSGSERWVAFGAHDPPRRRATSSGHPHGWPLTGSCRQTCQGRLLACLQSHRRLNHLVCSES
jgi:hypothetical protein